MPKLALIPRVLNDRMLYYDFGIKVSMHMERNKYMKLSVFRGQGHSLNFGQVVCD